MIFPKIGLGTWLFGGAKEADYSKDKEDIAIIKKAIDMGYKLIDTAEIYANNHCEELIGQAIQGKRDKLLIVTKARGDRKNKEEIINACKNSLRRLQTEYVDLYLIHHYNDNIKEVMAAMNQLKRQKLIKNIGVSNFSKPQLIKAMQYADIRANQIEYSVITRNKSLYPFGSTMMEKEVIPFCQKNNITIMAERPLERKQVLALPLLKELAKKYNKSIGQIALNWLIKKEGVVAIPMSRNHLKENLEAEHFTMQEEDYKKIDTMKEVDSAVYMIGPKE